jgi:hypothetical protein
MKKIAFCFLIYDIINHEELWNIFFKNIDINKYNIYIHYKYNKPLKYFEKYKLDNCIETKYADISLVKAQNLLIEASINDNCTHQIFISNSCIPLKPFNYVYSFLDLNFSYFNITPDEQCFPRCNKTTRYIDKSLIKKAAQWCILNYKHAKILINENDYINWFNYNETVPDEHCYITKLFQLKLDSEIITTPNLANGATTFVNWQGMDYKYPSNRGLKNYNYIAKEELLYLMDSKCLFGRKFNKECITLYIKEYITFIKST